MVDALRNETRCQHHLGAKMQPMSMYTQSNTHIGVKLVLIIIHSNMFYDDGFAASLLHYKWPRTKLQSNANSYTLPTPHTAMCWLRTHTVANNCQTHLDTSLQFVTRASPQHLSLTLDCGRWRHWRMMAARASSCRIHMTLAGESVLCTATKGCHSYSAVWRKTVR